MFGKGSVGVLSICICVLTSQQVTLITHLITIFTNGASNTSPVLVTKQALTFGSISGVLTTLIVLRFYELMRNGSKKASPDTYQNTYPNPPRKRR